MADLGSLPNLLTVGGNLNIDDTPCLSEAEAEAFVASIAVGGTVTLEDIGWYCPCE